MQNCEINFVKWSQDFRQQRKRILHTFLNILKKALFMQMLMFIWVCLQCVFLCRQSILLVTICVLQNLEEDSCFSLLWGQNKGWDWDLRFLQSRKPLIRCRASSLVLKHEGQSGQMTSCECVGKVRIMLFCVKSQVKSAVPEPEWKLQCHMR